MNDSLFIPDKCKVGFNPRTDTYSGKLAYVIAFDGKKWRKEVSWEGWIYNYITPEEYEVKKRADYEARRNQQIQYFNNIEKIMADHNSGIKKQSDWWVKDYNEKLNKGLEAHLHSYSLNSYEKFHPSLGRITMDENLKPFEFDNVPTEGFVLNKRAGGYSSGWNHRQTYARVYDPRGFEFEINIENLLFILQECNSIKGKALEGEFVYSWSGKDLILLPTSSSDYTSSKKFTEAQKSKVSLKDLIVGHEYMNKQMENIVYVGRLDYCNSGEGYYGLSSNRTHRKVNTLSKGHIFFNNKYNMFYLDSVTGSDLSYKVSDSVVDNFETILTSFEEKYQVKNLKYKIETSLDTLPSKIYLSYRTKKSIIETYIKLSDNEVLLVDVTLDAGPISRYYQDYPVKSYEIKSRKKIVFENDGFKVSNYTKYEKKLLVTEKGDVEFSNVKVSNNNKDFRELVIK